MKKARKKRLRILVVIVALCIVGSVIWKVIRANTKIPEYSLSDLSEPSYSGTEKVLNAISLSFFTYGCEQGTDVSGTVSELLDRENIGILTENYGIVRTDKSDPATALFDTSDFIRNQVGNFRFLCELRNDTSSFYGVAFCDDEKKCVWIAYCGSVSTMDAVACVGLVLKPGLTSQEKSAFKLFEAVLESDEVKNRSYCILLTGHSLGGAFASMVSRVSGCEAVTVNGANGLGIDKINSILNETPKEYHISNHMTSPKNSRFSLMDAVQRFIFLGSYKDVECHIYHENGFTYDPHCAFSFVKFRNEDFTEPFIPEEIVER